MAGNNSEVDITIKVVDQNSGQVVNQVTKNIEQLGNAGSASGQKLAAGLNGAAEAGTKVGSSVSSGMAEAGAATAETAAEVEGLTGALGGVIASAGALAGAMAAAFVVSKVVEFVQSIRDADAAAKQYAETLKKVRDQEFAQPRDAETARMRFQQQTALAQQRSSQIADSEKNTRNNPWWAFPVGGVTELANQKKLTDEMVEAEQKRDKLGADLVDKNHQQRLEQIELNHAMDGTLAGQAKINAALEKRKQINEESRRYSVNAERASGNPVSPDAGTAERTARDQIATGEAAAQTVTLNREMNLAIMRANDQRIQAGLSGEALYQRKMQDDIRELSAELTNAGRAAEIPARIREINTRYLEDASERWVKIANEAALASQRAAIAGLSGQARLDAQHNLEINQINSNRDLAQSPGLAAQERGASNEAYLRQSEQLQESFYDRISQMDENRTSRYSSENDKITATTRRTIETITKAWEQAYGQLDVADQRRVQSQQALNDEITKINADAARQQALARQRIEDQTIKAEESGARYGQNPERQRTQAILDEYNDRIRQLEELRARDAANADLYRRQEIAAEQEKNGKLLDQQRQLRDKLAGELRGFFSNPLEALRRQGEEAASKIAADFILKMQGGGTGSPFSGYGDPGIGGRRGGVFGSITSTRGSAVTSTTSTLQATTATIYVQSATIASGGGVLGGSATTTTGGFSGAVSNFAGVNPSAAGGAAGTIPSSMAGMQTASDLGKQLGIPGVPNIKVAGGKLGGVLGSSKAAGVADGALGLFSAYQSNGGVTGALGGAVSGAKIGAQFGGVAGAAIGAIAGGIMGLFGFGGRAKAESYDRKTIRPAIANELQGYQAGSTDYQTAYNDLDALSRQAKIQTRQWGSGGSGYYDDTIKKEIEQAQQRLTREEQAGRGGLGMTAAQFDTGGMVSGFGSMATSGDTGWVHAKRGEFVVNQQAVMTHGTALELMRAGASSSDMAQYYGGSSQRQAASSSSVNLQFVSHDPKGALDLFMANKHHIRAALNESYAENSGGYDFA